MSCQKEVGQLLLLAVMLNLKTQGHELNKQHNRNFKEKNSFNDLPFDRYQYNVNGTKN
tara:strand:+ start:989 stop:1162 length:174 start_codon:yes stop_codon:yes gene_type:complete